MSWYIENILLCNWDFKYWKNRTVLLLVEIWPKTPQKAYLGSNFLKFSGGGPPGGEHSQSHWLQYAYARMARVPFWPILVPQRVGFSSNVPLRVGFRTPNVCQRGYGFVATTLATHGNYGFPIKAVWQTGILNQPCLVSQDNLANKSRVVTGYPMTHQYLWNDLLGSWLESTGSYWKAPAWLRSGNNNYHTHITQTEGVLWHWNGNFLNCILQCLAWSYIVEDQPA